MYLTIQTFSTDETYIAIWQTACCLLCCQYSKIHWLLYVLVKYNVQECECVINAYLLGYCTFDLL